MSVTLLTVTSARGAVVFSNLGPGDTFSTDTDEAVTGVNFYLGDLDYAGGFTLAGSSFVLDSVEMPLRWYENDYDQEPLVVRIFADSAGLPGTELASVPLNQFPPAEPALVTVDFSPAALTLNAGTTYWLIGDTSGNSWFGWMHNITGDLGRFYTNNSNNWLAENFGDAPAFRINGTPTGIPEPGALVLAGLALLSLASFRQVVGKVKVSRRIGD
jgi:hypothetical protein